MPALEAVLSDLEQFDVDGIIVAGDMIPGPNPSEVVHRLHDLGSWMILGNNENYLLRLHSGAAPDWWYTSHQWAFSRWIHENLDEPSQLVICSLPEQRVIDLPGTDSIRVVHGSPNGLDENLHLGTNPVPINDAFEQVSEPVLICGHSHIPWQVRRNGRLALNPGAICPPLNGDLGAQYALLEWSESHWKTEHRLVKYDTRLVRTSFLEGGLLEAGGALARACLLTVETGQNVVMDFLHYAYNQADEAGYPGCEFVPDDIWDQAAETFNWEKATAG